MRINVPAQTQGFLADRLQRLSPTRREEVGRGLALTSNDALDNLINHLDDVDPDLKKLLLDEGLRDSINAEVSGSGYRGINYPIRKDGTLNRGQLVVDESKNYGGQEQALIDLYSLRRELDNEQSGVSIARDTNDALYESIERAINKLGYTGITKTAKGGISGIKEKRYGSRDKHPSLPALDDDTAIRNVVNQLYDNAVGNPIGEQASGMMMKSGKMTGIPVEHLKDFNRHPELGYSPENRMLGSTLKNSIIRDEPNSDRKQVLLLSAIAEKELEFERKYGMTPSQAGSKMNYEYQSMNDKRIAGNVPILDAYRQALTGSTRTDSPGANRERSLNIDSGGGDVTIEEGVLRSNGKNGNGKNGKH